MQGVYVSWSYEYIHFSQMPVSNPEDVQSHLRAWSHYNCVRGIDCNIRTTMITSMWPRGKTVRRKSRRKHGGLDEGLVLEPVYFVFCPSVDYSW